MRTMPRWRHLVAATLLVSVPTLTACSSDSEDDAASAEETTTSIADSATTTAGDADATSGGNPTPTVASGGGSASQQGTPPPSPAPGVSVTLVAPAEPTPTTQAAPPPAEEVPETTVAAAPDTTPAVAVIRCRLTGNVGTGQLTVTASSAASGGNRGITKVTVARANDENATLTVDLTYLGPETGNGDQWTTNAIPNGTNFGNRLTITATSSDGKRATVTQSLPCSIG